jgi:organic hydroperoxide reductase OsmC/OhrA
MPAPFPHHYSASIIRATRSRAVIDAAPRPPLSVGPPPEFDGNPHVWSPEHLLLSAIGACLFTTFEALAAKDGLEVLSWHDQITGVVDKTAAGLAFTSIKSTVELSVKAGDAQRANAVLAKAKRFCLVSNALRIPVELDARVSETSAAA